MVKGEYRKSSVIQKVPEKISEDKDIIGNVWRLRR